MHHTQRIEDQSITLLPPQGGTEILILQPTTFCNINCDYCYLPHRASKQFLSHERLRSVLENLRHDGIFGDAIEILWHGGEPLTLGIEYFKKAKSIIDEIVPTQCTVTQTFQTNGVLLDQNWCAFFRDNKISVGLSIDGPKHLHDNHRKTRSGGGTFDKVLGAVRLLQSNDLSFYVISVLSLDSLRRPDEIFRFAREVGIHRLCFNIEETEGINESRAYRDPEIETLARRFYERAISEATGSDNPVWVREVYQMFRNSLCQRVSSCAIASG